MSDSMGDGGGAGRGRRRRRHARMGLWLILSLLLLAATFGVAALAITGKPLRLPVWAVAEAEARMNAALPLPDAVISLEGVEIAVGRDWMPRLRLEDLRLALKSGGGTVLRLPEARISFDPAGLLRGQLRPAAVTLSGAAIRLQRDAQGRFNLAFGDGAPMRDFGSFADLLDRIDAVFAAPALASLTQMEADALSLVLEDARAKRVWRVGDGRLVLANGAEDLGMELGFTLANPAGAPARALLAVTARKGTPEARLRATVEGVPARDISAQSPLLALLSVLDAPISGKLNAGFDASGRVSAFDGSLSLGAGALQPSPDSQPVAFDSAVLDLGFDPAAEKIALNRVEVQSPSLRLQAQGHVLAPGVLSGNPEAFLAQIAFSRVMVDPAGLFVEPVTFREGALDMRLRLDPFRIEVGQLSLREDGRRLQAQGAAEAGPGGWRMSVDLALDAIRHDRLLALWPLSAVPKTRQWVQENVQEGLLRDVKAAFRIAPGQEPRFALGYDFADADVRFIKTLPPIRKGHGYATIDGNSYTMVLDQGEVTPPAGGRIDMAGSVFSVLDILQKPAQAEIRLKTRSSMTAALSLLDEPPFRFLTKAGKPVELGEGRAEVSAVLRLPLVDKIKTEHVSFRVEGRLSDVQSDVLVPGRRLTAAELALTATPAGLELSGAGKLADVPFEGVFRQPFGPEAKGRATVEARVDLTQQALDTFAPGLPAGFLSGRARAQVVVDLVKDAPPALSLTSDLKGAALALPEIGWQKSAGSAGRLELEARLGTPAQVPKLRLSAPGLQASGRVILRGDGKLDRAEFSEVRAGDWLVAPVTLAAGQGGSLRIAVAGGRLDLRRLPETMGGTGHGSGRGSGAGSTLDVRLDRVEVTESITLAGLRGEFTTRGGFNGSFLARMAGGPDLRGTVVPMKGGTGIRVTSGDAGGMLAAAGIFSRARGGDLELQLTPLGPRGQYRGRVTATSLRVRDAPLLAELLSAISVVGLLEQLNGEGLLFTEADADFRLTPAGVEVRRGAAVGPSIGVSMAGTYDSGRKVFNLQGVISPIYLLNGIGQIFTRRGEGLFGFNYAITGTPDRAEISVNPLSILTPGMFRDIFRRPVPRLEAQP